MLSGVINNERAAGHPFRTLALTCLLLWPIGLEQFLPLILVLVYAFVFAQASDPNHRAMYFMQSQQSNFIWIFIFLMLISSTRIVEFSRLFTFMRDITAWICAAFFFSHFDAHFRRYNLVASCKPLAVTFWAIVISCAIYVIIGSIKFPSIGYLISPGFIKDSMTGSRFLLKDFGEQLYFYGFMDRVSSFFGSPIHLACVVFLLLPFVLNYHKSWSGKVIVYLATIAVIFFAQARIAILMIALYPILFLTVKIIFIPNRSPFSVLILSFIFIGGVMAGTIFLNDISIFIEDLFFGRRAGSAEARSAIYLYSWEWIQERPLFGYGTQIDISSLDYPLGSHSTPLGMAFKYGIPAALIMSAVLASTFYKAIKLLQKRMDKEHIFFYSCLVTSLTCYFALMMLNEFVVDLYHHLFLFSLLGAIWGNSRQRRTL